jgi:hypothetical protein
MRFCIIGFRRVQIADHEQIVAWLTERALEHDKPTLLFQMICERLKQQQMIRPAVTTLSDGLSLLACKPITSHCADYSRCSCQSA